MSSRFIAQAGDRARWGPRTPDFLYSLPRDLHEEAFAGRARLALAALARHCLPSGAKLLGRPLAHRQALDVLVRHGQGKPGLDVALGPHQQVAWLIVLQRLHVLDLAAGLLALVVDQLRVVLQEEAGEPGGALHLQVHGLVLHNHFREEAVVRVICILLPLLGEAQPARDYAQDLPLLDPLHRPLAADAPPEVAMEALQQPGWPSTGGCPA